MMRSAFLFVVVFSSYALSIFALAAAAQTRTVLVTGGAGYIGSHTCLELLNIPNEQYDVVVVDNLDNGQIGFDPSDLDATEHIEAMLPRGFLRSIDVSLYQILQLSSVLGADVRKQLEDVRGSMKD